MENLLTDLITNTSCAVSKNVYSTDYNRSDNIREALVFNGTEGRAYFKVTMPAAPRGSAVTRAEFTLTSPVHEVIDPTKFTVYNTTGFDPSTLSWSNQPQITGIVPDDKLYGMQNKLTIDLTDKYDEDLSAKTFYFAIFPTVRNTDDGNGNCQCETVQTSFYSENSATGKPAANIYYISSEKLRSNTEYLEIDMGRTGKGQVDLFNGNFSFTHTAFNIAGTTLPLSISMVYDKNAEVSAAAWNNRFFSPLQTLVIESDCAVYTDASGYKHYFKEISYKDENGTPVTVYRDTAGLNLVCSETSNGHVITDKSQNRLLFDSSGRLVRVEDRQNNFAKYTYSGSLVTRIVAGNTENEYIENNLYKYEISYSGSQISKITAPYSQSATYTSSGVSYSTGKSSTFTFSSGRLTQIQDSDGLICDIAYLSGTDKVSSVKYSSKYASYGESVTSQVKTEIDRISISYTGRTTTVTAKDGSKTFYRFDDTGKSILTYAKAPGTTGLPIPQSTPCVINRYKAEADKFGVVIPEYREITVRTESDCRDNILGDPRFQSVVNGFNSTEKKWSVIAANFSTLYTYFIPGTTSLCFSGTDSGKCAYQFINLGNTSYKENLLVFSAWAKAQSAVQSTEYTKFGICVDATYANGKVISTEYPFNPKITDWQFGAIAVETKKYFPRTDDHGYDTSTLTKIGVWLDFTGNLGSCYFNAPRLEYCNGNITEYILYKAGAVNQPQYLQLETIENDGTYTKKTVCDKAFQPEKEIISDKSGNEFTTELTYSGSKVIKKSDYHGTVTRYTYNNCGKPTKESVQSGVTGAFMQTTKSYSADGKDVKSETDENQATTSYVYGAGKTLSRLTDPNGQVYNYSYTSANELSGVSSSIPSPAGASILHSNSIGYSRGYVTELNGNNLPSSSAKDFKFTYDGRGRNKTISAAGTQLVSYSYNENNQSNQYTDTANYATGESITAVSDGRKNPLRITYKNAQNQTETLSENTYRSDGLLETAKDNKAGVKYLYRYNSDGNVNFMYRVPASFSGTPSSSNFYASYSYATNDHQRLINFAYNDPEEPNARQTYTVQYNSNSAYAVYPENTPELISLSGKFSDRVYYDKLSRVTSRDLIALNGSSNRYLVNDYYNYENLGYENLGGNVAYPKTGTRVRSIDHFKDYHSGGYTHTDYQYDSAGNITKIREIREVESETQNPDSPGTAYDSYVEHTTSYEYDGLGRITTETEEGKRYLRSEYTYDERGNILSKSDYKFNMSKYIWELDKQRNYVYNSNGWKDQLVSSTVFSSAYDPSCCQYCNSTITENFSYNSLGNPTVYRSHSLAWERVNLLKQFGSNTFTYSADGMRLSKNNIRYDYLGDRLLKETRATRVLRYYYGLDGVIGFNLRNVGSTTGTDYYFRKNLQGDVISVVSSTGDVCASYRYDAFGNCEIVSNINNIADINPIRYRSYYFDTETGLYYLQTRYYDPEIGRFISPDSISFIEPEKINGLNLYAYCYNNPVMYSDPTGRFPLLALIIVTAVLIGAGATIGGISAAKTGQNVWAGIGKGALAGALIASSIVLAVSGFYVPGGFTSVLGSMMTFYGISATANFLEVAVTQGKYSESWGNDFWESSMDIIDSILLNSGKVAGGYLVFLGFPIVGTKISSKVLTLKSFIGTFSKNLSEYKASTAFNMTMSSFWKSKSSGVGRFMGYVFTGLQIFGLLKAIFTTPDFENSKWTLV